MQRTPHEFQERLEERQLAKTQQSGEGVIHGFDVVREGSGGDNERNARGDVIRAGGQTKSDIRCTSI